FRSWVQECNTSHPDCVKRRNMPLPTRVIDVGLGENLREPRLYIPKAESKGTYATLSYCWGTSHNAKLTSGNLVERLKQIPLEELPQTLRDAIEVARELHIPYLWIDALCILQDSLEDWQRESAKMGAVYGNSFLTIQAAGADDASKGCFLPRTASPYDGFPVPGRPVLPYQPPVRFPFVDSEANKGSVYVRFGRTPDEQVVSPAQLRGWICQENLLSPRLLAFGAYKLFWECASAYRDESGTEVVDFGSYPGLPRPIRRVGAIAPEKKNLTPLQKLWSYVVTEYSHRRLKYPGDKLPGLAGIAQRVSLERPGDEYCAGLWRNDMPENLMWSVALEHDQNGRLVGGPLETYRSPSWSWAAWDG
ncbi:HET-domain-containing protein, partial [Thozetella sp. PMI_491]